jgi:hypothetical protein
MGSPFHIVASLFQVARAAPRYLDAVLPERSSCAAILPLRCNALVHPKPLRRAPRAPTSHLLHTQVDQFQHSNPIA